MRIKHALRRERERERDKEELPGEKTSLREFGNYRHPGPRRVWKGGSELQSPPPFREDPVDPGENSQRLKIFKKHKEL